jgi:hypothetical protein
LKKKARRMAGRFIKIKTHRDGTISYFSDRLQRWVYNVGEIPEDELSRMTHEEMLHITRFLEKHKGKRCL